MMNDVPFFIHLSCTYFFLVCVCVFFPLSKRPEDWEESIFVRHKESGCRLRDDIHFHMYISTSPCGDGRLNSPYEISTDCKFFLFFFKSFMVPEKHKGVHCLCSCHRTFRFIEMISWISFNVTLSVSCTGLTPKIFYL